MSASEFTLDINNPEEPKILCVLVKMPCNLAVLDRNAADSIPERFSEVTDWYIGGHSLGGAMAAWINLQ